MASTPLPPHRFSELTFGWTDYTLFGSLLGISILIGIYFGFCDKKKQDNTTEYLMGGKTMKYFPVAMSLIARWVRPDFKDVQLVMIGIDFQSHIRHQFARTALRNLSLWDPIRSLFRHDSHLLHRRVLHLFTNFFQTPINQCLRVLGGALCEASSHFRLLSLHIFTGHVYPHGSLCASSSVFSSYFIKRTRNYTGHWISLRFLHYNCEYVEKLFI